MTLDPMTPDTAILLLCLMAYATFATVATIVIFGKWRTQKWIAKHRLQMVDGRDKTIANIKAVNERVTAWLYAYRADVGSERAARIEGSVSDV